MDYLVNYFLVKGDRVLAIPEFSRLVKGALVSLDSSLSTVTSTIAFQYNPDTLTRTLQVQSLGTESGGRAEVLRLQGAPIETFKLEAEFDASGRLPQAQQEAAPEMGIYPQLSALESLIYPTVDWAKTNMKRASEGTIEIIPHEVPMTLFIWGAKRVLPVRLADFSITEEAYDINLNPIRAKVSLSLRVLNYNDLPWSQSRKLFLPHHQKKEKMAKTGRSRDLGSLGITNGRRGNVTNLNGLLR